ncbi:hypothetical protein FQN49_000005 [Arthroderma sp. PD_2]|nr:hypothetical protein FQN49_000005 [Arthroderma sp. PD_2]
MDRWGGRRSDGDLIRPSSRESARVLHHSQKTWQSLLCDAQLATKLPESCSNIRSLLNKTPSIPDTSIMDITTNHSLLLEGYSRWKIQSTNDCDLSSESKNSRRQQTRIGVSQPSFCHLSDEFIPIWTGFNSSDALPTGNYLCAFVLGWSYILSARLIELRTVEKEDKITYTTNQAVSGSKYQTLPGNHCSMHIGEVDQQELRWWSAILANGCGWRATLTRSNKEFLPPWACHLSDKESSIILHHNPKPNSTSNSPKPPSSAEAQSYLVRLATMYDASDQLLAAFTAALTLPKNNRFGAPIILPMPQAMDKSNIATNSVYGKNIPTSSELPHFMALSCIPSVISSCLFGSFWEPIQCNLVSEWLHEPLQKILPSLISQKHYCTIVQMLATRRPNIAPLWLGSTITGLLPRILNVCTSFIPPICLEAAVWTQSPQSFMDPCFYRMPNIYRDFGLERVIPREDEFRLLYLTDIYSEKYAALPLCPYSPFGAVKLRDTALEIRLHFSCGHSLDYSHWVWQGSEENLRLDDYGFSASSDMLLTDAYPASNQHHSTILQLARRKLFDTWVNYLATPQACDINERLSECATRNLFSWTFFPDGTRLEDKQLWRHEWLSLLLNVGDGDSKTCSSMSGPSKNGLSRSKILHWLQPNSNQSSESPPVLTSYHDT